MLTVLSNLFQFQNQEKIWNNIITENPSTPQVCAGDGPVYSLEAASSSTCVRVCVCADRLTRRQDGTKISSRLGVTWPGTSHWPWAEMWWCERREDASTQLTVTVSDQRLYDPQRSTTPRSLAVTSQTILHLTIRNFVLKFRQIYKTYFTARRYASEVYAVVMCLCLSHSGI